MSLARPRAISGRIAPQLPRFYKHFYDYTTFVSFAFSFFSCTRVTLLTRSRRRTRIAYARPDLACQSPCQSGTVRAGLVSLDSGLRLRAVCTGHGV
jgi:hypothetical protein